MTFWSYCKPGMLAIMKRFGNGIQSYNISIEICTYFQIYNILCDVVQAGFGFCILLSLAQQR